MSEKIPKGWKWVKLGEEIEIMGGGTPKTNKLEYWNGNISWLTIADFNNVNKYVYEAQKTITELGLSESSTKLLKPGDIIISARGTIGAIAVLKKEMAFNQSCYGIRSKSDKIYQDFLYYLLKNSINTLLQNSYGAVFDTITRETFSLIFCPLPPLPEQKAIAEVLSSLDDKIDLLHRQNKTLEEMAMTLFRQWFIDPTKDGLPEGWEEVSLGEFIKETLSGDWGKDKHEEEYKVAVNCIRGTDISDLQNGLPKKTPVRFLKENKFKSIEPKDGDIIIEISGGTETQSTGRSIYISSFNRQLFEYPIVFSNFCRLLRPKENCYTYYLYLYLKYLYINDEFFSLENGTSGIKNLDYKTLLYDLKYPMPKNTEIYLSFYENVSILFEKIDKNKFQIQTLEKLRDTLLPKLMSGELRVKV